MATKRRSRRQKVRSLAEVDYVNSNSFRQGQFLLQLRQRRLLRTKSDRLLVHDKELTEMKTFFSSLREIERPQYEFIDIEAISDTSCTFGTTRRKQPTDKIDHDTVRQISAGPGESEIRRRIEKLDRPLSVNMDSALSVNEGTSLDVRHKTATAGSYPSFDLTKSNSTHGDAKISNDDNVLHLPLISPRRHNQTERVELESNPANLEGLPNIRFGLSKVSFDSSSEDECPSIPGDDATSRRRRFKDAKKTKSRSLESSETPRPVNGVHVARRGCLKQFTPSQDRHIKAFQASQKNILQRRKSSSDIFSTKQMTPGQLVELQYKREKSAMM